MRFDAFLQPDLDPSCAECNITLDFNFVSALSCAAYVRAHPVYVYAKSAPFFTVNGVTYQSPTVPVLLQILNGSFTAQDLMPQGSVYTLPRNKTIQINMPGGVLGIPHPLHLHGVSIHIHADPARLTALRSSTPFLSLGAPIAMKRICTTLFAGTP